MHVSHFLRAALNGVLPVPWWSTGSMTRTNHLETPRYCNTLPGASGFKESLCLAAHVLSSFLVASLELVLTRTSGSIATSFSSLFSKGATARGKHQGWDHFGEEESLQLLCKQQFCRWLHFKKSLRSCFTALRDSPLQINAIFLPWTLSAAQFYSNSCLHGLSSVPR